MAARSKSKRSRIRQAKRGITNKPVIVVFRTDTDMVRHPNGLARDSQQLVKNLKDMVTHPGLFDRDPKDLVKHFPLLVKYLKDLVKSPPQLDKHSQHLVNSYPHIDKHFPHLGKNLRDLVGGSQQLVKTPRLFAG